MHGNGIQHCERTGRIVSHCGCGECYARRLANLVREDKTLRTVSNSKRGYPRYLVTNAL
jgi:predicted metal-binding protein